MRIEDTAVMFPKCKQEMVFPGRKNHGRRVAARSGSSHHVAAPVKPRQLCEVRFSGSPGESALTRNREKGAAGFEYRKDIVQDAPGSPSSAPRRAFSACA